MHQRSFCIWWLTYYVLKNPSDWRFRQVPSVALVALVAWVFYWLSQWISQLTRLLALSSILAPVLSFFTAYWLGYAATMLYLPLWLLVLLSLLPMLATWAMMLHGRKSRLAILADFPGDDWLVRRFTAGAPSDQGRSVPDDSASRSH